jgi:hypothetical protein
MTQQMQGRQIMGASARDLTIRAPRGSIVPSNMTLRQGPIQGAQQKGQQFISALPVNNGRFGGNNPVNYLTTNMPLTASWQIEVSTWHRYDKSQGQIMMIWTPDRQQVEMHQPKHIVGWGWNNYILHKQGAEERLRYTNIKDCNKLLKDHKPIGPLQTKDPPKGTALETQSLASNVYFGGTCQTKDVWCINRVNTKNGQKNAITEGTTLWMLLKRIREVNPYEQPRTPKYNPAAKAQWDANIPSQYHWIWEPYHTYDGNLPPYIMYNNDDIDGIADYIGYAHRLGTCMELIRGNGPRNNLPEIAAKYLYPQDESDASIKAFNLLPTILINMT